MHSMLKIDLKWLGHLFIRTVLILMVSITFQRQSEDDNNAITSEYDLYSDEYDSIDREGRADEGGNLHIKPFNNLYTT